ncbi:MAG: redox-regulated ATPase YchF [Candidatus Moranbacteria bacterium]|nr:redox-regulated ATPase YchF [Candidatus Moranbacteria bacterium]
MQIGIVGLPNVGKSTLFKALTKIQVDINNYPFCTIEPNVGIVEVPDERVDKLAEISGSGKKIYSPIEFVDIAGLVKGAAEGHGLGNQFLHNIREVDAIVHVVRLFQDENISHVDKEIDPARDISVINTELLLADLETVRKRIAKLEKQAKSGDKETQRVLEITRQLEEALNESSVKRIKEFLDQLGDEFELIRDLQLLSFKPMLYVFNTSSPEGIEEQIKKFNLEEFIKENLIEYVVLNIKTEEDLLDLSDEEKQELEIKSELSELIKKSYQLLNLITFLTTGEPETRAWQIPENSSAPRAGRAIHSDFEEKFIKAEVVSAEDLIRLGSKQKARESGLLKMVGKDYTVRDGDVIEFKI